MVLACSSKFGRESFGLLDGQHRSFGLAHERIGDHASGCATSVTTVWGSTLSSTLKPFCTCAP